MKKKNGIMVSLTSAKWIAGIFFCIGTLLFLVQLLLGDSLGIAFLGAIFIVIAIIFNSITLLLLIIDLVRKDLLESFFGICIILLNVPIAAGYAYILIEFRI
ncbi:MAG: hypothetical protein AAFP76_11410 [Bacteroidota bacterium]